MKKTAVVAIGGNAVNRPGEKPTAENMIKNLAETARYLVDMLDEYDIVITHGNGPQVGNLLLQQEAAKDIIPPFPLDVNDAQTQGSLGYMITLTLQNELVKRGKMTDVAAVVTRIVVDKNDKAFMEPTKPVGPFYSEEEAKKLMKEKGWKMVEDAGRGWRRVVPSPQPLDVVEKDVIKLMLENNKIVIAAGGGGIPVIRNEDGTLSGVEAVIDKDRASALLAIELNVDTLIILTGVEKVYLNFGKPDQKALEVLTIEDAQKYLEAGEFPKGSMGPKIESSIRFVKATGREALITDMTKLKEALEGKTGTRIVSEK
ncbi:MAG: carbamate kinase [Thermotogaceae bacterium]|nr:carbamate kinase [Thermotogaceae bacterium]